MNQQRATRSDLRADGSTMTVTEVAELSSAEIIGVT